MNSVMTRSNTYLPDAEKTRGIQINNNKIIERFQHDTSWLDSLTTIDEKRMYQPIAEGKWSSVRNGEGMTFPDFGSFNQQASDYSKSDLPIAELLAQAKYLQLHV